MSQASSDGERLAREFFASLSAGNYIQLERLFTADAVWTVVPVSIPGSGDHEGARAIVDGFREIRSTLFVDGDPKLHITNCFSSGRWVAVETHTIGRLRNGATYDNRYCWILEIADGRIHRLKEYMDGGYVAQKL